MNAEAISLQSETQAKQDPVAEMIVRFKNRTRPKKAATLNALSASKQSLVGDYSCCSHLP